MNREIKDALVQLVVRIIYAVAALMLFFIVGVRVPTARND
jgi:hypothetical protein